MNHYTGYELLWLFFIYSFGGWVLETISATLKQRKFANRGLVNGPFCVLYGLTAIAMTVGYRNFGESGYLSLRRSMQQLQNGSVDI